MKNINKHLFIIAAVFAALSFSCSNPAAADYTDIIEEVEASADTADSSVLGTSSSAADSSSDAGESAETEASDNSNDSSDTGISSDSEASEDSNDSSNTGDSSDSEASDDSNDSSDTGDSSDSETSDDSNDSSNTEDSSDSETSDDSNDSSNTEDSSDSETSDDSNDSSDTGESSVSELIVPDFTEISDGTSLEDYGFTVSLDKKDNESFIINNGVIELNSENGWFDFSTSAFKISRNNGKGITAEWKVRYQETISVTDREKAKFYLTLLDREGNESYSLLYKPYLRSNDGSSNIEFSNASGLLASARTGDKDSSFTSSGSDAEWISFRLNLESDGSISILINGIEHMNLNDSAHTDFSRVKFTYRTGSGSSAYQIQVKDLSVKAIE